MLMEFYITLQGDFWWRRKNVVPLHCHSKNIINHLKKQKELWQQKEH